MSALDPFRSELRVLLGDGVLLRRDRTMRALFICDAPRRAPGAHILRAQLLNAGYDVDAEGDLWRLDLSPARRQEWIASLAPGRLPEDIRLASLCRSLLARGEIAPGLQPWPLIRLTLLYLDAGETQRLYKALSGEIAILKRAHAPLPTAAAYLIEETQFKGGTIC